MPSFKDVSKSRKSFVWHHFYADEEKGVAKCQIQDCGKVLKLCGGNTSTLIYHLKSIHNIGEVDSKVKSKTLPSLESEPKAKVRKIDDFFAKKKEQYKNVDQMIAEFVSLDGFTFNQIAKSKALSFVSKKAGFELPESPETVKKKFMKEKKRLQDDAIEKIQAMKEDGDKFSLSFDESTSLRNRRYMNLNLHFSSGFQSLGLVRIMGSLDSSGAAKLVKKRLKEFGIDFDTDIIATMTDNCSMMKKFGRETKPFNIGCLAHILHLCVMDVLYKETNERRKKGSTKSLQITLSTKDEEDNENGEENEEDEEESHQNNDDMNDDDDDDIDVGPEEGINEEEEAHEFQDEKVESSELKLNEKAVTDSSDCNAMYKELVRIVRGYAKMFKMSPTKNYYLSKEVQRLLGKEKCMSIDVKTRWDSLLKMLDTFLELLQPIKTTLAYYNVQFSLQDLHIEKIKDLVEALQLIELAVKQLCKENATLIDAENSVAFTLHGLKELNTRVSKDLYESLKKRFLASRNEDLAHLMHFLSNPSFFLRMKDDFDIKISRKKIATSAIKLYEKLYKETESEVMDEQNEEEEEESKKSNEAAKTLSLIERFQLFQKSKEKESDEETNMSAVIRKEIDLYVSSRKERSFHLEQLFKALGSIRPTSVEAERAFSSMNYFGSKLRARLNDDTLDALVFMRQTLRNNK